MSDAGGGAPVLPKRMRLRYVGQCRTCASQIPAGTMAVYHRETKTVTCVECPAQAPRPAPVAGPLDALPPEPPPESSEIDSGTAGASAKREFERRKARRESKVNDAHPYLGKLIIAVTDEPQSTRAWATGARGEQVLGDRLDKLALSGAGVSVLHDRRIPRSKANIDHIAVSSAGVFVIDAKKYTGRPSLRAEGGLLRPRTEKLLIGSRDRTKLVTGVRNQVGRVQSGLETAGLEGIPVHGVLCFVDADWPLIGGAFIIDGVQVLWPKKAVEKLSQPGLVDEPTALQVYRTLASTFPPA